MKYSLTKSESFQLVHCEALKSQIPTKDNLLVPCAQDGIVLANQFVQSFTSLVLKGIPPNQTHVQSPIPLPPSPSHQRKVLFFNNTGKCQANLVLQLNMSYFPTKGNANACCKHVPHRRQCFLDTNCMAKFKLQRKATIIVAACLGKLPSNVCTNSPSTTKMQMANPKQERRSRALSQYSTARSCHPKIDIDGYFLFLTGPTSVVSLPKLHTDSPT